ATVFTSNPAFAAQWHQLVDFRLAVECVADEGEGIQAVAAHPAEEMTVAFEMHCQAGGRLVMPGHQIGDDGAAGEGGVVVRELDAVEPLGLDAGPAGRPAYRKASPELAQQVAG